MRGQVDVTQVSIGEGVSALRGVWIASVLSVIKISSKQCWLRGAAHLLQHTTQSPQHTCLTVQPSLSTHPSNSALAAFVTSVSLAIASMLVRSRIASVNSRDTNRAGVKCRREARNEKKAPLALSRVVERVGRGDDGIDRRRAFLTAVWCR
jgi:hypothetical protein